MEIIPFDDLPQGLDSLIDLHVDAIYEGGTVGDLRDEPIHRVIRGAGNSGGFRMVGLGTKKRVVVLYTSGENVDWPDALDTERGRFVYFGDNQKSGRALHATKGNRLLQRVYSELHAPTNCRPSIPPFLVFSKSPTATSNWSVRFIGLAVPGYQGASSTEDLVAVWKSSGGIRFQNYRAVFTVLDVPVVSAAWLRALLDDDQWSSGSKSQAPEPYKRWLETGVYQPLCAEPTRNIRSIQEQTPRAGAESAIVKEIYAWFSDAPHAFERFAAFLYALHDQRVRIEGVTRKSVDGGRDAVGAYRLGVPSDPVLVEFALEAKCYRPPIRGRSPNTVGVKEVSRLISRIRHRQFGILVTTSVVARQAYQEVRDDGHPIVFLAGRDIAEILIGHGFQSVQQVKDLLRAKFQV